MKYKEGDEVRVKRDLIVSKIYSKYSYTENMSDYKGKIAKILEVHSDYYYLNIDDSAYAWTDEMLEPVEEFMFDIASLKEDQVDHPKHYNDYPVEVIDMMEKVFGNEAVLNFCLLNAFKYRMRAGHKIDTKEDFEKEKWYLDEYKKRKQ